MKVLIALLVLGLFCGCSTRARYSVALMILPASVRDIAPEKVSGDRADLAKQLTRRGYAVINDHKSADYILHAAYLVLPRNPSIAELVEIRMERNPMKDKPFTQHSPRSYPAINDDISGTEPR